jgi:hypothetical protein
MAYNTQNYRVFGLCPSSGILDGACGRYYMSSQIFPFFLCIGAHALDFVGLVCSINTSFSILVRRMCVLYYNFYCIFSCYLVGIYST